MSLLQHLPEDKKVKAVFLVSAFRDDLGWDALTDLFTEPFDFEIIRTKADKFVFLHSDNDPYCLLNTLSILPKKSAANLS